MTLFELVPGQTARITDLNATPAIRQRMLDMGLIPQARVTLERIGPSGQPMQIDIKGCKLALRKGEAQGIQVSDVREAASTSKRQES